MNYNGVAMQSLYKSMATVTLVLAFKAQKNTLTSMLHSKSHHHLAAEANAFVDDVADVIDVWGCCRRMSLPY